MKLACILLLCLCMSSCSEKHQHTEAEVSDEKILVKINTGEELYFDFVYQAVLKPYCIECHSNSQSDGNVNLSSFKTALGSAGFKSTLKPFEPNKSSLYQTVVLTSGNRVMPPKPRSSLSQAKKDLIYNWINQGARAKGFPVNKKAVSIEDQLKPFFESPESIDYPVVNKLVFSENCLDCHSSNGSKPDHDGAIEYNQDMTNYEALFTQNGIVPSKLADYVKSEDGRLRKKRGSRIYQSIALNHTMPPTKDGYKLLDSNKTKLLMLWIKNCAIEDYAAIKDSDTLLDEGDSDRVNGKVRDCL